MTIKNHGGVFGRNPTFNDVSVEGDLSVDGTLQNGGSDVLVSTDIGSTVQGYDATILTSSDIGSTVQGYDADTTKNDVSNTFTDTQTIQKTGDSGVVVTQLKLEHNNSGSGAANGTGNAIEFWDEQAAGALQKSAEIYSVVTDGAGTSRNADLKIATLNSGRSAGGDSATAVDTLIISGGGAIYPATDDAFDCGIAAFRWDDVYATNGTIQTSDRNEKQDIEELSEAEQRVAVAAKQLLRKFRWKSAVEEKGDDARIHFGIIAQDLQAAFEAEGLDAGRYAMFINTEWWEDADGVVYNSEEEAPASAVKKSRMGVRYSELLAFIIAS